MKQTMTKIDLRRWQQVLKRDHNANSEFVYAVKTTGIFCLPSCPSKRPRAENIMFFDTADEAIHAGFRACKRCQPDQQKMQVPHLDTITQACKLIENSEQVPTLNELAA